MKKRRNFFSLSILLNLLYVIDARCCSNYGLNFVPSPVFACLCLKHTGLSSERVEGEVD